MPRGPSSISSKLLAWYDVHARRLPWRYRPGERADAYRVWLSEVMLQQTTVAAVKVYFERFTTLWPGVSDLAAAPLEDVMREWAGLGYYARARNLHAAARAVAARGGFPDTEEGLRQLPGVGPYTAAAVAAIAFDRRASPVDGNIERVVARLFAIETPLPAAKAELRARAATLTPARRAGDFAQAMMDLGATICTPRNPACSLCPLSRDCVGYAQDIAAALPRRAPRAARPDRAGAAFVLLSANGNILVRRRPPRGLLGGMLELPTSPWGPVPERPLAHAPQKARWARAPGEVEHVFTHFRLTLAVYAARVKAETAAGTWLPLAGLEAAGLPSLMRKVAATGLAALGEGDFGRR